jgi:iron-sulfur cluster insertion protein|tara:strand:+ start:1107 stop:1415 length:309 start_codon:yes stop_codon:yes gene_type:complete
MIQLTNEALNHLENLTKEHNKKYVRLQVKGGGCAGFEYEWSFEDEDNREDMIIENVLLIDRMNELYLRGMHLDYKKEIWGSSFVFENPMAKSSCGCGTSFSV